MIEFLRPTSDEILKLKNPEKKYLDKLSSS